MKSPQCFTSLNNNRNILVLGNDITEYLRIWVLESDCLHSIPCATSYCVSIGKLFNFSLPQLPHQYNGDNNSTYLIVWLRQLANWSYICICVCMCVHIHIWKYVYMYMCMHVCIYVHIYMFRTKSLTHSKDPIKVSYESMH